MLSEISNSTVRQRENEERYREGEMLREAKREESLPSPSPFPSPSFLLGELVRCQHQCTLLYGWAGTESAGLSRMA